MSYVVINTSSKNGLLSDMTKPLLEHVLSFQAMAHATLSLICSESPHCYRNKVLNWIGEMKKMKCSTQNIKRQRRDASASPGPDGSANESCYEGSPDKHLQDLSEHCSWPSPRNICIWPRGQQPHWESCKGRHQQCSCFKWLRWFKNIWAVLGESIVLQDIYGNQGYLVGLPCVLDMVFIKNRLGSHRCGYLSEDRQCLLILWNCYLQCLSPTEQVLWFTPSPTEHSQPFGGIYPQYGVPKHHHKPVFPISLRRLTLKLLDYSIQRLISSQNHILTGIEELCFLPCQLHAMLHCRKHANLSPGLYRLHTDQLIVVASPGDHIIF